MADAPVVHIGENSPEFVAYRLMEKIFAVEKGETRNRKTILNTYAACLLAIKDPYNQKDRTGS